jgi:hypothetical protein
MLSGICHREIEEFVAVATADFRDLNRLTDVHTRSGGFDPASAQAEQTGFGSGLEHKVWAGIGHGDARYRTLTAQIWRPFAAIGRAID